MPVLLDRDPGRRPFCFACGTAVVRSCPSCGAEAPPEARFCMSCGTGLDDSVVAPSAPPPEPVSRPAAPRQPEEERRQVTVLFADLSGYTAVAERMDPEAVKRLIDRTLGRLKLEVDRHGGTVDKFIGDNVMAVFGAPVAPRTTPSARCAPHSACSARWWSSTATSSSRRE